MVPIRLFADSTCISDKIESDTSSCDTSSRCAVCLVYCNPPSTIGIKTVTCYHQNNPLGQAGFRIMSQSDDLIEIEVCGRCFYISASALAGSWMGQWVLFRWSVLWWGQGVLKRLLEGSKNNVPPFHFHRKPGEERPEWELAGGLCGHSTTIAEEEIKYTLTGRLFLLEQMWQGAGRNVQEKAATLA